MSKEFYWKCPDCGMVDHVDDLASYTRCAACGVPVDADKVRRNRYYGADIKRRCPNCGEENSRTARFCSSCGARIDGKKRFWEGLNFEGAVEKAKAQGNRLLAGIRDKVGGTGLYRLENGKVIGGVCAGLAQRFKIQANWIRIGLSLSTAFGALPLIIVTYLVLWAVLPLRKH